MRTPSRPKLLNVLAPFVAGLVFWSVTPVQAQPQPPTQGFRECTELCYMKECGEAGIKCPTVKQKRIYRRLCHGRCVERMRRQAEDRRIAAHQRRVALERERAQRIVNLLQIRHRQWIEKKQLTHNIRMQYQRAKQQKFSAVKIRRIRRKMQRAHEGQLAKMREKLHLKEKFYASRRNLRTQELTESQRQIKRLQNQLRKAKLRNNQQQTKIAALKLRQERHKKAKLKKKKAKVNVKLYATRVKRHQKRVQELKVVQERIKEEKQEAGKQNKKEKLEDLARRLGELAGKQAAAARQAELDKAKLKKARLALANTPAPKQ